jgi:RNA polymerase sigma-70 factor (ECF subfamily)
LLIVSSIDPPLTAAKPTFQEVFHAYGRYVVRVLRHLGVREADVQDACQEVFTVVYRRLSSLESEAALPSWIYAIAWRVARDHRRRGRRKPEELSATVPETLADDDSEEAASRRQQREMLVSILDQIEENRREIFVLYELGELGMAEIAGIVGCPLQTAYARLHAARKDIEEIVRREKARGKFR